MLTRTSGGKGETVAGYRGGGFRVARHGLSALLSMIAVASWTLTGCVAADTAPEFREENPGTLSASTHVSAAPIGPQYLDEYGLFYSTNRSDIVAVTGQSDTSGVESAFVVREGVQRISVPAAHRAVASGESGVLAVTVPNLKPNTTYYFRFYTLGSVEWETQAVPVSYALTVASYKTASNTWVSLSRSNATPDYGAYVTLKAALKTTDTGATIPSQTVLFERYTGTGWASVGTVMADSNGEATASVRPYKHARTTYRGRFAGVPPLSSSESADVVVKPHTLVTPPTAPATMYKRKARTIVGYLKPRHTEGSTTKVRIYRYRQDSSGAYVKYDHVHAKLSDYGSYSKYKKSFSFPSKGSWRIRAYAPADSKHAAQWSTYDYVTVK